MTDTRVICEAVTAAADRLATDRNPAAPRANDWKRVHPKRRHRLARAVSRWMDAVGRSPTDWYQAD